MMERDRLVAEHLTLVQAIAGKLKRTLGRNVEFDDLVGYGNKGLIEAAERFDGRAGVSFTTFAYYRIRGAMLDGMRTMGWYGRGDYARYRAEERANEYMQNAADRDGAGKAEAPAGTPAPDAATNLDAVASALSAIATIHITSIDAAARVPDERLPPPDAGLETGQMGAKVREALAKLPEKERRLLELYYYEDKKLEDAGAALGLSKSWACRLHARAVSLLREAMGQDL